MKHKPTMLMILDGYGINKEKKGNAILQANTPNLDKIFASYPGTTLTACGEDVGLPNGQMGNSEVGHLNIGAGRIIYQDFTRISLDIKEKKFFQNQALKKAIIHAKENGSSLHLLGLMSDGGVHSHIDHVIALLQMAKIEKLDKVYLHCFLDGRDVPPKCAAIYIEKIEKVIKEIGIGSIATLSGRYYSMDRDKHWDRIELVYNAMTKLQGKKASSASLAIEEGYARLETDEFLLPTIIEGAPPVQEDDSLIMFNFRPDRGREITKAFVLNDFTGFEREKIKNLSYVTMTQYESDLENVVVAYPPQSYSNTLGEYISSLGLPQLRIAETEKYAHVTFFFNGGVEEANPLEDRILVPSPKVATFDLQPEMSAYIVTEKVIEEIRKGKYPLIILNFANADMVGHTGIMEAAIKAVEALDQCVYQIVEVILEMDGQLLLTADHGNADVMLDEKNQVITAHSLNPVPLYNISNRSLPLSSGGRLSDLAPTLLDMMCLPIPKEMTGRSLLKG